MKQVLLLVFLFFSSLSFSQVSSGLVLSGGGGDLNYKIAPTSFLQEILDQKGSGTVDYKLNAGLGYRFRIRPLQKKFFYDVDVNFSIRSFVFNFSSKPSWGPDSTILGGSFVSVSESQYYSTSINPTFNYNLFKGLNAGVGVEPTYYFYQSASQSRVKFDVPATVRLAYNFRFLELAVGYKYGLCNVLKSDNFESGRFNDWQVSLFIPF